MARRNIFLWVDVLRQIVVSWASERIILGLVVLFRTLYVMISRIDAGTEILVQLTNARYPGVGTPTALDLLGQSRGLIRGIAESNADFAAYLLQWIELWKDAGSQLALAKAISHYCGGKKVRSFNRGGTLVTLNVDGTHTVLYSVAWDWDSISNPKKATHWSELWLVVYDPPWPIDGQWGAGEPWGDTDLGFGHDAPRIDVDAINGLMLEWKAAHSRVNTLIFCYDATLFDPTDSTKMPDGYFGKWGKPDLSPGGDPDRRVRARFEDCRYWHSQNYRLGGIQP